MRNTKERDLIITLYTNSPLKKAKYMVLGGWCKKINKLGG